ncbi:hypothetical protein BH10PSE16_BH10PSE16_40720 [soil metagenome]
MLKMKGMRFPKEIILLCIREPVRNFVCEA